MSYQALYRTWRPQTFHDVVGQEHITRTLQNAIVEEKFTHAYLFSGPRGTGKTSAAKIFAKTINCENGPAKEPCNECAACLGIQDGSISDVIEIDAASNTSVDDIREIRDKVKYASSVVPYKVYIIDEVHMISVNAFNALLKTLEEPPKHVVFILATTEPHKIPLTIISRCQRFDFRPISNQAIVNRMEEIITGEHVQVDQAALETVALAAEGGMRDALSILDQAISYSSDDVTLDDVLAVTGSVGQDLLENITKSLYDGSSEQALTHLDEMLEGGKDPGRFVFDLIYFLRDILLYKSSADLADMIERARVNETFSKLSETIDVKWIQRAILELNHCQQEMKWTNSPKVFIEIALLQIAEFTSGQTAHAGDGAGVDTNVIHQLTDKLARLEKELGQLKNNPERTAPPRRETRQPSQRPAKSTFKIPYEKIRTVLAEAERSALQDTTTKWATFLTQLKNTSAPAHAKIVDSKPAAASSTALVVAFKYEIHCSLFLDNKELAESILEQITGKKLEMIPIPEAAWQELRNEYVEKQGQQESKETDEPDSFIEEARKLVGDDLLDIHDE